MPVTQVETAAPSGWENIWISEGARVLQRGDKTSTPSGKRIPITWSSRLLYKRASLVLSVFLIQGIQISQSACVVVEGTFCGASLRDSDSSACNNIISVRK